MQKRWETQPIFPRSPFPTNTWRWPALCEGRTATFPCCCFVLLQLLLMNAICLPRRVGSQRNEHGDLSRTQMDGQTDSCSHPLDGVSLFSPVCFYLKRHLG